ncbi:MAG: hypothetical protein J7502_07855, partial [Flavisolibacter sp.]|nr:hypothetical protein [Flavisolibacter sp.]
MRKIACFLAVTLLISRFCFSQSFSVTTLSPISIGSIDTQHKPQGKTWFYAGKWWAAIPPSVGGTKLYRLDGTTWTQMLNLSTSGSRPDCWVVGDLVHILLYKGSGTNSIVTLQYNPATSTYNFWSQRPTATNFTLPTGVESATLTVDGTGRMWVADDIVTDMEVRWSDAPYTTWSNPIILASGTTSDDICAVTKLNGKVGLFWSNQTTGLFGFRTHTDGANPASWTATETPGSESIIPGNPKMADDHMNLVLASDGTLYVAAKTSYDAGNLPELVFFVRRPSGIWDPMYTVTTNSETDGTQAIVVLNEVSGKVKVVYTSATNGGSILCKESSISNISFGSPTTLITDATPLYNFSSSTHFPYNPTVAIIATKISTPRQVVSVLLNDQGGPPDNTAPTVSGVTRFNPTAQNTTATSVTYQVSFSEAVSGVDNADFALTATGSAAGSIASTTGSGSTYQVTVSGITGTGTLRLDVKASGTGITDPA